VGGGTGDDQQVEDLVVAKDRQPDRGGRMKKVTSWAAIVAVPTGVAGFYGMNVPYPRFAQHRCMASSQLNSLHLDMEWL
jgi:CorA-like Mg2+ transporter protein